VAVLDLSLDQSVGRTGAIARPKKGIRSCCGSEIGRGIRQYSFHLAVEEAVLAEVV